MPNANAHDTQEMLWQVESELRQIHAQIDCINVTIRPWQDELVALKDYRKQLLQLQETLQRRKIKPRVVTVERRKPAQPVLDEKTKSLIDVLQGLTPEELSALCAQVDNQNGECHG